MMKTILLSLAIATAVVTTHAQSQKPEIVTDRPDQTESPSLVPTGGVQVETGFVYENDKEEKVVVRNYTYNTTLVKYGVNDFVELRMITEFLGQRSEVAETQVTKIRGMSPLALGVKIKLNDEKGFWPQAAFIGHINLKTGSSEYMPSHTAADFRFTFAHTLSDRFSLSYNLGAEWDGEVADATYLYTLSLGYAVSKRIGVYIETYSFFPEAAEADNRFDGGLTYKFTPVIQWDISAGIGLCDNAPDSFVSTGMSFRLFE